MADSKRLKDAKDNPININGYYKYDWNAILEQFEDYIDNNDNPILVEFLSAKRGMPTKDAFDDECKKNPPLLLSKKRQQAKREAFMLKRGQVVDIFALKQPIYGYKDKQDVTIDGNITQTIKPILLD